MYSLIVLSALLAVTVAVAVPAISHYDAPLIHDQGLAVHAPVGYAHGYGAHTYGTKIAHAPAVYGSPYVRSYAHAPALYAGHGLGHGYATHGYGSPYVRSYAHGPAIGYGHGYGAHAYAAPYGVGRVW